MRAVEQLAAPQACQLRKTGHYPATTYRDKTSSRRYDTGTPGHGLSRNQIRDESVSRYSARRRREDPPGTAVHRSPRGRGSSRW